MKIPCIGVTPLTGVKLRWESVPIALRPALEAERCDLCGFRMAAVDIFFDGRLFLCPGCRSRKGKRG